MLALTNKFGKSYVYLSTYLSLLVFLLLISVLAIWSFDAWWNHFPALWGSEWIPTQNKFGILPMLFGSFAVTLVAMVFAIPFGIGTAIYLSEFLPSNYRLIIKSLLELLAGLPSILYGLIGVAFLSIWIQDLFGLQTGRTILTGGVLLAVMVLPTIITLTDDILHQIPWKYRENARGLGLLKHEEILHILLPMAKPGIIGAILLALGRAMGETMAVMLVIGSIDKIPHPIFNWLVPGQTITSKLGREVAESSFGSPQFSALILMGLLLMSFVMLLTYMAQRMLKKS